MGFPHRAGGAGRQGKAGRPAGPSSGRRLGRRRRYFQVICLVPILAYLSALFAYPTYENIRLGFYQESAAQFITNTPTFIGLGNYGTLLHDGVFVGALGHTLLLVCVTIPVELLFGLLIALLLNRAGWLYASLRALLLLPWLLPVIVTANIWLWMLDQFYGVLNYFLVALHITSHYIPWVSEPAFALWAIIIANSWLGIPFYMMILYAGLRGIPKELYEAARIDGAGAVASLRFVTLPLLKDVVAILVTLGFIYGVKTFDIVWLMTRGGPANATHVLGSLDYLDVFTLSEFGYGAAIANVMLLLSGVGALVYIRATRGRRVAREVG